MPRGQEQRDEHEQRAERVEPDLGQRAGEVRLRVVDEHRAQRPRRTSVPRPPTATQITTSIELMGANSLGLMMPTCGT